MNIQDNSSISPYLYSLKDINSSEWLKLEQDSAKIKRMSLDNRIIPSSNVKKPYVLGAVIMDVEAVKKAGEYYKLNLANMFNPQWQQIVETAAQANGGLGNEDDGYLAWSNEGHFVRLRNTALTPEQNKQLALISLQGGWAVEDLPSRRYEGDIEDPHQIEVTQRFLDSYNQNIEKLINGENEKIEVKDAKHLYRMQIDKKTGIAVSDHFKYAGGLKGFIQKNSKWFSKIGKGLTAIGSVLPGWWKIIAGAGLVVNKIGDYYSAGKNKLSAVLSKLIQYFNKGVMTN